MKALPKIPGYRIETDRRGEPVVRSGGMARVYRAVHVASGEVRAVKVLRDDLEPGSRGWERFRHEALITRTLCHLNIVRVFEVCLDPSAPHRYMVMEWLEGESLSERLQRERCLKEKEVVRISGQICDALHYIHSLSGRGVLHRDLKPSNIILERGTGRVVLIDFGIALSQGSERLTEPLSYIGTVEYMSPDQVSGQTPDGRADLYSLGAVMYQMAAGRVPFTADNPLAVLQMHCSRPPDPPRRYNRGISERLEAVILRLLEKDPARRFQSAADVRAALGADKPSGTAAAADRGKSRPGRGLAPVIVAAGASAAVLAVIIAALLVFVYVPRRPDPSPGEIPPVPDIIPIAPGPATTPTPPVPRPTAPPRKTPLPRLPIIPAFTPPRTPVPPPKTPAPPPPRTPLPPPPPRTPIPPPPPRTPPPPPKTPLPPPSPPPRTPPVRVVPTPRPVPTRTFESGRARRQLTGLIGEERLDQLERGVRPPLPPDARGILTFLQAAGFLETSAARPYLRDHPGLDRRIRDYVRDWSEGLESSIRQSASEPIYLQPEAVRDYARQLTLFYDHLLRDDTPPGKDYEPELGVLARAMSGLREWTVGRLRVGPVDSERWTGDRWREEVEEGYREAARTRLPHKIRDRFFRTNYRNVLPPVEVWVQYSGDGSSLEWNGEDINYLIRNTYFPQGRATRKQFIAKINQIRQHNGIVGDAWPEWLALPHPVFNWAGLPTSRPPTAR